MVKRDFFQIYRHPPWTPEDAAKHGRTAAKVCAKRRKQKQIENPTPRCVHEREYFGLCGRPALKRLNDGRWMCTYHHMVQTREAP